jgi:hypothetical protein
MLIMSRRDCSALVSTPPMSCVRFRGTSPVPPYWYGSTRTRPSACICSGYGSQQQADAVVLLLSFAMLFFFYSGTDCMVDFLRSCMVTKSRSKKLAIDP